MFQSTRLFATIVACLSMIHASPIFEENRQNVSSVNSAPTGTVISSFTEIPTTVYISTASPTPISSSIFASVTGSCPVASGNITTSVYYTGSSASPSAVFPSASVSSSLAIPSLSVSSSAGFPSGPITSSFDGCDTVFSTGTVFTSTLAPVPTVTVTVTVTEGSGQCNVSGTIQPTTSFFNITTSSFTEIPTSTITVSPSEEPTGTVSASSFSAFPTVTTSGSTFSELPTGTVIASSSAF